MLVLVLLVVICSAAIGVVANWVQRPTNLRPGTVIVLLVAIIVVTAVVQLADREYSAVPMREPVVTSLPTSPTTASAQQTPVAKKPSDSGGPASADGSSATFKHFKVTVRQVRRTADVQVLAEVCVRSLPPDPQGNRTRISWDPWSIQGGSKKVDAARSAMRVKGGFPADNTYRVGQCASGWIPFPTTKRPARIIYNNGVGDVAVWDANHLDDDPSTI